MGFSERTQWNLLLFYKWFALLNCRQWCGEIWKIENFLKAFCGMSLIISRLYRIRMKLPTRERNLLFIKNLQQFLHFLIIFLTSFYYWLFTLMIIIKSLWNWHLSCFSCFEWHRSFFVWHSMLWEAILSIQKIKIPTYIIHNIIFSLITRTNTRCETCTKYHLAYNSQQYNTWKIYHGYHTIFL